MEISKLYKSGSYLPPIHHSPRTQLFNIYQLTTIPTACSQGILPFISHSACQIPFQLLIFCLPQLDCELLVDKDYT